MTAPARRTGRKKDDFYPTPAWMTDHLLDRLDLNIPPGAWPACRCDGADIIRSHRPGDSEWVEGPRHEQGCPGDRPPRIIEPCVGEGHIRNAIERRYPGVSFYTNDIDRRHPADEYEDATSTGATIWRADEPDWVISNPPFDAAFGIVSNAFDVAQVGVAMLLRVTWLEPLKTGPKAAWLAKHPPQWELVMERYSFDGSGKLDSAPTAWFVWSTFLTPRIEVIPGRGRQEGLAL